MKIILTALLLFFYSPAIFSQSMNIQSLPGQHSYSVNTFPAGDKTITISSNQFELSSAQISNPEVWSISSSNSRASFVQRSNGMYLYSYNAAGDLLIEKNLEFFSPGDNTINTYQFDNGSIILRDNVANFTFLNAKGETAYQVSNSSGSTDGEQESQLATDPKGNTVVLYIPVIAYGSNTGSSAQLVYGDQDTKSFYSSREYEIVDLDVSESGAFIILVASNGSSSIAMIFDRFGNELYQIDSDEDLIGATLDENASHLTIYSSGRVQVYEVPGGERLGSASSRSSILFAGYDSDDETILALGGVISGLEIDEPEITAVSLSKRAIVREEVPFPISTLDLDRIKIRASSSGYEILGLNRPLLVDVVF